MHVRAFSAKIPAYSLPKKEARCNWLTNACT